MVEGIKKFKKKGKRKRKMDNRLSYLLMYEKGAKLKMDLSFGNTNLKLAITGSRELISYEDFVAAISPLLPQVPFQLISF